MVGGLFNNTRILEKAIDGTVMRNEAITQNIANIDTPNYKRKTVAFEKVLSDALDSSNFRGFRTDKKHIPIGGTELNNANITITEDNTTLEMRLDGNNVDIDAEMALMAKNNIIYNALVQKLSGQFRTLKSVISEGRK
ncbi:flagellar basal body rod protein FlgB [Pseudobacteroides cellulosolvens]|uniref:Flagellar basal body rod protein FlgB n=1 Tax=Pseudobacteroides cellulosolvens ATCC 35603 = DSM 2933 TaxID=398512 RepID=A0A0L6JSJ4_9FIRM|nr:flagellar basal body rod protein FlgB [Pseudobacteroides cellulosolvens]KNY28387.1 flagellar basal-body rod protein FlgB [Pseudobacteroides cellulosolvens ATCC 35603 = DSM 2933]